MNVGEETIEWLYSTQLQVDGEWSVRRPTGFTWWGNLNAQTIEIVGEQTGPEGQTGYVISVRTDMVEGFDLDGETVEELNTGPMRTAALAGPVYDSNSRRLSLCSLALVHDENASWMRVLLSAAAVSQLIESMLLGPGLAEQLGAEQAVSGHPEQGLRSEPDEMAFAAHIFTKEGQEPSRWPASDFEAAVQQYMMQPPSIGASSGSKSLTVEFPYGDGSSLCQITGEQPHPLYGNGLLVLQRFPFAAGLEEEGGRLALELNREDLTVNPAGYGLGSYSYVDGMVYFTEFVPNSFNRQVSLRNIYYSCATRARSLAVRLLDRDWDANSFTIERSATGRMMREPTSD